MNRRLARRPGRFRRSAFPAVFLTAAFLFNTAPGRLGAQEAAGSGALDRLDRAFLKSFFDDLGKVVTAPGRWTGKDFAVFGGVAAAGGFSFLLDEDIRETVQDSRSSSSDDLSGFFSNFGDGLVLSAGLLGFYAAGERAGDPTWRRTALLGLKSLGATALLVMGSKFVIGRARPRANEGRSVFRPFSFKSTYYALPSGHAASAWAVAATIADQSGNRTVDAVAYGLAALASLSRVHDDKHWTSDVVLGSALGYFTAKKVCALNRPKPPVSPSLLETAQLSFDLAGPRTSLTLSWNW
ncbi:MAG: phosphatase PAP2 family protein [Candidatus Aminicenantes bacterium]|nr:phosphatase PAP2 family protein [Candidatus Aminicenantes bacterium]